MQLTEHKKIPGIACRSAKPPAYLLLTGILFASVIPGCATFDKVSGKFTKTEKTTTENDARQAVDAVPNNIEPKPVKKPLLVEVQEKLRTLGYYSGPISGKLDSRSEAAIQDFQLDNDLRINGRVTPSLLKEIDKAVEQK